MTKTISEILEEQLKYTCPHEPPKEVKDCEMCRPRIIQATKEIKEAVIAEICILELQGDFSEVKGFVNCLNQARTAIERMG